MDYVAPCTFHVFTEDKGDYFRSTKDVLAIIRVANEPSGAAFNLNDDCYANN